MLRNYHPALFVDKKLWCIENLIYASGSFGILSIFVFDSNNWLRFVSKVNKNRVSILC